MGKKVSLGLVLFIAVLASVGTLELQTGRIRLVLHENIGRFSLYYLNDVKTNTYIPLLLDQDPRTTVLTVLLNNKTIRMGETAGFTLTTEKTVDGGLFTWKSSSLEVYQNFSFIKSKESAFVDAVKITLTLKNTGDADASVGAKYLLDTYLGEASQNHFSSPSKARYLEETSLKPSLKDFYFFSADPTASTGIGLQVMLMGEGITPVSEVVFANWKRLNENPWKYQTNSSRNFNLLPYSINDSAAALYYDEEVLRKGDKREIVTIMGNRSSGFFEASAAASSNISNLLQQASAQKDGRTGDLLGALKSDLLTVEDLIRQINTRLGSAQPLTGDEVLILQRVLDELKQRKSRYE